MQLEEKNIEKVVKTLELADGEDVQEILIRSGFNMQMLSQLMMSEPFESVYYFFKERQELENRG